MVRLLGLAFAVSEALAFSEGGTCVEIGAANYDRNALGYVGQQGHVKDHRQALSMSLVSLGDGAEAWFFKHDLKACPAMLSMPSVAPAMESARANVLLDVQGIVAAIVTAMEKAQANVPEDFQGIVAAIVTAMERAQANVSEDCQGIVAAIVTLLLLVMGFGCFKRRTVSKQPVLNPGTTPVPGATVVVRKPGSENDGKVGRVVEYDQDQDMWAVSFLNSLWPDTYAGSQIMWDHQRLYAKDCLEVQPVANVAVDIMICVTYAFKTSENTSWELILDKGDLGVVRHMRPDGMASVQFRKEQHQNEYWLSKQDLCLVQAVDAKQYHLWDEGEIDAVLPIEAGSVVGIGIARAAAGLKVEKVAEGLVSTWNQQNPRATIEERDLIVNVNGLAESQQMQAELEKAAATAPMQIMTKLRVRKASRMFVAEVVRSAGAKYGAALTEYAWGVVIDELHGSDGLLTEFNHSSEDKFEAGDVIVEVNGRTTDLKTALGEAPWGTVKIVVRKAPGTQKSPVV